MECTVLYKVVHILLLFKCAYYLLNYMRIKLAILMYILLILVVKNFGVR
jgi:hypothetical protein